METRALRFLHGAVPEPVRSADGTGITGIVVATIAVITFGNFGITFSASVERGTSVKAEEGWPARRSW